MFSVDNFYNFFESYYGWEAKKIVPWVFTPHGSKNLGESFSYTGEMISLLDQSQHSNLNREESLIQSVVIMHDQESFFHEDSLYIYRQWITSNKKNANWQLFQNWELFLARYRCCSWPILCHSEKNSIDIAWAKDIGCIPCYFFWHGLIARDWFRHWKHHAALQNRHGWQKRFLLYIRDCSGRRSYRSQIKKNLYKLQDQIDCDWHNEKDITPDFSANISIKDAQSTAIHLVAETLFKESKIHVTEKVFKPMVMKQPFIVFATAGTLEYLRNYGFRTFDGIWDESYDIEQDHEKRMNKIIKLIKNLYLKNDQEFSDIMCACQDIVDHNQKHFFSEAFENQMLEELHANMQTAIEQQQKLMKLDPGGCFFHVYNSVKKRDFTLPPGFEQDMENVIKKIKNDDLGRYQQIKQKYNWC